MIDLWSVLLGFYMVIACVLIAAGTTGLGPARLRVTGWAVLLVAIAWPVLFVAGLAAKLGEKDEG